MSLPLWHYRHPILRIIRYGFAIYGLSILLISFGRWMILQTVVDDCSILAKLVIESSEQQADNYGGSLVAFANPQKVKFINGKALICTAQFNSVGRLPSGTYNIARDRKAVYWETTGISSPGFDALQNEYNRLTQQLSDEMSSQVEQKIEEASRQINESD